MTDSNSSELDNNDKFTSDGKKLKIRLITGKEFTYETGTFIAGTGSKQQYGLHGVSNDGNFVKGYYASNDIFLDLFKIKEK